MNKQTRIVVAVLAGVAVGAGVLTYVAMTNGAEEMRAPVSQQERATTGDDTNVGDVETKSDEEAATKVEVVFSDNGFSKDQYTLRAGETLLIKNDSSQTLQVSSDDHPTHTLNGELNAPAIAPGETTGLTPTTPGMYGIHDHIRSQFTTIVEVTE